MRKFFYKNLKFLFTGSFAMVLAACYGMPVDMETQITIQTVNSENEPIKGLKVTLLNNQIFVSSENTDEYGEVYYPELIEDTENDYKVKIEDIDGAENGEYPAKEVDITEGENLYKVEM